MHAAVFLTLLRAEWLLSHAMAERIHLVGKSGQDATEESDRSPCSGKYVDASSQWMPSQFYSSCPRSWSGKGRCNVINGMCLPNCASKYNQDETLCEANFCKWIHPWGVCTFNEANATFRRSFCRNQSKELKPEQADFCEGMLTGYQIKLQAEEAERGPCSGKDLVSSGRWDSCPESWNMTGRCNVLDGICVPNCDSKDNQNENSCEASFCQWLPHLENDDGSLGVCTFSESNATFRRTFCRNQAGALSPKQAEFCSGMPMGYHIKTDAERHQPVRTILREMARCWRPNPRNRSSYDDVSVQGEMIKELDVSLQPFWAYKETGADLPFYPVTTMNPLRMFGNVQNYMPYHYSVMTTHPKDKNYMDSFCLRHMYDNCGDPDTLKADPHGCCLFKQSFSRLKDTSACVRQRLEQDPYRWIWTRLSEVAERDEPATSFEKGVVAANLATEIRSRFGDDVYATDLQPENIHKQLSLWRECKGRLATGKCQRNHIWERMVEFMQAVENSDVDWSKITTSKDIKDLIFKSLAVTFTIPLKSQYTRIHNNTLDSIAEECFGLPGNLSEPVPEETLMIRESTACFPLTWDAIEIPGQPKQALWQTDWQPPVEIEYKTTPPICGRMALAGLTQKFTRTPYPWNLALLKYSSWPQVDDSYCLNPAKAQCKNFKLCWQRWLNNHVRIVHPLCETNSLFDLADEKEQAHAKNSFTCCCRPAEKIAGTDYNGDCDSVKHQHKGMLGDRYFNSTTKSCCKWVDDIFGCRFHWSYTEAHKDQCSR